MDSLAGCALVLRELVHDALGRIAEEPWLHEKRALARHAHDDARALGQLLGKLRTGAPAVAVIDGADVYSDVKPALAAALREAGEAELAALQDLHVMERPVRHPGAATFALPTSPGPALGVRPLPEAPERDPFVEPGTGAAGAHARLNAAILAGELAARTAHEHPDAPWGFHADLARLAHDRLDATAALDAALVEEGTVWGEEPVALGGWQAALALDVAGRLSVAADPENPEHAEIVARWS